MSVTSISGNQLNVVRGVSETTPGHHTPGTTVLSGESDFAIELTPAAVNRRHNRFYVAPEMAHVSFKVQVVDLSQNNIDPSTNPENPTRLVASIVPADSKDGSPHRVSLDLDLATVGSDGLLEGELPIPLEFRNRVNTLSFALVPQDGAVDATIRIFDIRLVSEPMFVGRTGDVITVNSKQLHPDAEHFEALGFGVSRTGKLADFDELHEAKLHKHVLELRGDWTLHRKASSGSEEPEAGVVGTVLFSHRLDSTTKDIAETKYPFAKAGFLYFAPGTENGLLGDAAPGSTGFQGFLKLYYRVDGGDARSVIIQVNDGFSERWSFDSDDLGAAGEIKSSRDTINNMRAQQRLNYLDFVDYEGRPLAVDGIVGPRTASAISLFRAAIDPSGTRTPNTLAGDTSEEISTESAQDELDELTVAWLNSSNAPRWTQLARQLTHLVSPMDTLSTTLQIENSDGLPAVPFTIRIDREWMMVTSTGGTTLTVVRGAQETVPAAHSSDAAVLLVPLPEDGFGTNWLFDSLAAAGLIAIDADGVPDFSRVKQVAPRRWPGFFLRPYGSGRASS